MLAWSDCSAGPAENRSRSRSRSWWTLRFDVSMTTSASAFNGSSSARSSAMASDIRSPDRGVLAPAGLVAADEHVVGRLQEHDPGAGAGLPELLQGDVEILQGAGADVGAEGVADRRPPARASSATLGMSSGGRLSITKKPRSSRTLAAVRAARPGQPGDDRDVEILSDSSPHPR